MMRAALLISIVVLMGGCPKNGVDPRPVPRGPTVAQLKAKLELPPGADAAAAVRTLLELGEKGNREASWEVTHYLFDLYDQTRLTGDARARTVLWQGLGLTPPARRGPGATKAVVKRLLARVINFLRAPTAPTAGVPVGASPRRAAPRSVDQGRRQLASRLKQLLRSDQLFLASTTGYVQRLALLKSELRGPAGYAAGLRLYWPSWQRRSAGRPF